MADRYEWRGAFTNAEMSALHAEGFGGELAHIDWRHQVMQHSLGWVCARREGRLIGFVNVAWDGGAHAFLLDTVVAGHDRHLGIGTALVAAAVERAAEAGCEWLHVDFEDHLRGFYHDACGFVPTRAGLIRLRGD